MKLYRVLILILMFLIILPPLYELLGRGFFLSWKFPNLFPSDFSINNILFVLEDKKYSEAIVNSVTLTLTVTILSMVIGFFAAKTLGTMKFRGNRFMTIYMLLPSLTSNVSFLYGLRYVLIKFDMYLTYESLIFVQLISCLPYSIMLMLPVFKNYDTDYERQAATLGSNWFDTLIYVTLPAVKSGLAVAFMYTFMVSWAMFLAMSFFAPVGFYTISTLLVPLIQESTDYNLIASLTMMFILPAILVFILTAKRIGDPDDYGGKNI